MEYRAYILDDEGRHTAFHLLDCANDAEAKKKAAQMLDGHDIEIVERGRQVAIIKHTDKR